MNELNGAIQRTTNSTPGGDGIPARVYKALSAPNREKFLSLLNNSLNSGEVPSSWKTAIILPIWKNGKPKNLINSYRPIALTAVGCKIMERILLKRILDWIMSSHPFSERHFGFVPSSDCTKALSLFHSDISRARSKREFTLAAKLDILAAYDSVWLDGLLYKMAQIGIAGKTGSLLSGSLMISILDTSRSNREGYFPSPFFPSRVSLKAVFSLLFFS